VSFKQKFLIFETSKTTSMKNDKNWFKKGIIVNS